MAKVTRIEKYGDQFKLYYDDGTFALALPTAGFTWVISGNPTVTPPPTGGGSFSWPYSPAPGTVSSEYGPRSGPIGSFHEGIDFSGGQAVFGAKNQAANAGTVEKININSNYGNSVQLSHGVDPATGYGLHTIYAHFISSPLVNVGDTVTKGQVLGYLGHSGDAQGSHLHFETHTCPGNGPIRHNTTNTGNSLAIRTAINPRTFMVTYGDGQVIPQ